MARFFLLNCRDKVTNSVSGEERAIAMKRFIAALSICVLFASTPALAAGKDRAALRSAATKKSVAAKSEGKGGDMKKAIESRYWDMRMAIKAGDPGLYKKNLADDFVSIDLNNATRNADQIVAALGRSIPDDSRKENTTVDSLKVDGDAAEVKSTYDLQARRKAVDGSTINYHMVTTSNDMWVKKDGQWLLQKTQAETGDVYINDKLAAHRVRGEAASPSADTAAKPAEAPPKGK